MKVKSKAAGDRGINVKGPDGKPVQMLIHPGQEVDIELVDPRDPVFYGLVHARDFLLEEQMVVPQPPPAPPADPVPTHVEPQGPFVMQAPQTAAPASPEKPADPAPKPADPKK